MMLTIRQSKPEDKEAILNLLNRELWMTRYFDWKRDESFWQWKYGSNVFGKSITFVAEQDNNVIGTSTLWPWEFICRGRVLKAYQLTDTAIHSDYQGKGIFSKINLYRYQYVIETGIPIAFSFPNDNSLKAHLNVGSHFLSKLPWLFRPIKPFSIVRYRKKIKATSHKLEKQHEIVPQHCHQICDITHSFDGIIKTNRVSGFFNWRFVDHPFFHYGMISVNEVKRQAIAIFTIYNKAGNREMLVVDFIGHAMCSQKLFQMIVNVGKYYDVDFITTLYNRHFNMNSLWKLGFFKIKRKNMTVLPIDLALEAKLVDYNNWFMTGAIHDSI